MKGMARPLLIALDLVCVLIFALLGRATHGEALSLLGIGVTAWPFVVACLIGWLIVAIRGADGLGIRSAVIVWLVTVSAGLGLRVSTGDTAAWPFVIVTTVVLALLLLGWRLVVYNKWHQRSSSAAVS